MTEPRTPLDRFCIAVSFAFGIGLAPVASGTWGSLPGLALAYGLRVGAGRLNLPAAAQLAVVALALAAATAFAWWTIHRTEKAMGIHDDGRIVVDEVVGQAIAAAFLPLAWPWYAAAFAAFRLFDIWKPGPIGKIDRDWPGASGTLFDDIAAGLVAAVLLVAAAQFF